MSKKEMSKSLLFNGLTELARTGLESFNELQEDKTYIHHLPKGDGHPVLFIPGFLTGDTALATMREKFEAIGYKALPWGCGVNWGSSHERITRLKERFEAIMDEHPGEKISLVGWSLGGVYARELARAYPERVRCVVSMGSPFGAAVDKKRINPILRTMYEVLNPKSPLMNDDQLRAQAVTPPPVPTTSLFSKKDGVVYWHASLNPDMPLSENLDMTDCGLKGIKMSHSAFRINPAAITVIADRLAASADVKNWKRFDNSKYLPRCANVKIDTSLKAPSAPVHLDPNCKHKTGLFNPPKP